LKSRAHQSATSLVDAKLDEGEVDGGQLLKAHGDPTTLMILLEELARSIARTLEVAAKSGLAPDMAGLAAGLSRSKNDLTRTLALYSAERSHARPRPLPVW
jgi:hypothetical protein